jgi:hypothetical protein
MVCAFMWGIVYMTSAKPGGAVLHGTTSDELFHVGFVAMAPAVTEELRQWGVLRWLDAEFRSKARVSISWIRHFFEQEERWVAEQQSRHAHPPQDLNDAEWERCKLLRVGEWTANNASERLWQQEHLWVTAAPGAADEQCREMDHGMRGGARWLVNLKLSLVPCDVGGYVPHLPWRLRQLLRDTATTPEIIHVGWIIASPRARCVLIAR